MQRTPLLSVDAAMEQVLVLMDRLAPACIKVGITGEPGHRMYNKRYGYFWQNYTDMVVLHAGTPAQGIFLEQELIARLQAMKALGLQNILGGGENPPKGVCFTYVVGWCAAMLPSDTRRLQCTTLARFEDIVQHPMKIR